MLLKRLLNDSDGDEGPSRQRHSVSPYQWDQEEENALVVDQQSFGNEMQHLFQNTTAANGNGLGGPLAEPFIDFDLLAASFDGALTEWGANDFTQTQFSEPQFLDTSLPPVNTPYPPYSLSINGNTPSTVPSLSGTTVAGSQSYENSSDSSEVCFGMLHRVDVKLQGDGEAIESELKHGPNIQRFQLTLRPEHILLSFQNSTGSEKALEFGYLRPNLYKPLEKLLANKAIKIEAVATAQALREHIGRAKKLTEAVVKVGINIYGPRSQGDSVRQVLSQSAPKLWLQRPEQSKKDIQYSNPQNFVLRDGLELLLPDYVREVNGPNRAKRKPTADQDHLDNLLSSVYGSLNRTDDLSRVEGSSALHSSLLDHQKQALSFMMQRESGEIPDKFRLWQPQVVDGQTTFRHAITMMKQKNMRPEEKGGGLLADEMGMGKSLSILALIVETLLQGHKWAEKQAQSEDSNKQLKYTRSTLIIVSGALLINNWFQEIHNHLQATTNIKAIRYHGSGRKGLLDQLQDSDIVITTYNTINAEHSKRDSPLHKIGWYRVVLDEAHIIRRQATQFHRCCADLTANSRWCLTGTPIQNSLEDIGALFAFLKAKPFDSLATFRTFIKLPFERMENEDLVKERLVKLLDSLCLRRTREVLQLPGVIAKVRAVIFTPAEKQHYDRTWQILKREMQTRVGKFEQTSKFGLFQANLQLRIMCNHGTYQKLYSWKRRSLRDEREVASLEMPSTETYCSGCGQAMPVIGSNKIYGGFVEKCAHVLCDDCLAGADDVSDDGLETPMVRHCPLCSMMGKPASKPRLHHEGSSLSVNSNGNVIHGDRRSNSPSGRSPKGKAEPDEEGDDVYFNDIGHSSKMAALLEDVKVDLTSTKSIIFSCWTRTLNLVARHLERENIAYLRVDGECAMDKRQKILDRFASQDDTFVLLMTTGTGAFGLNLTCANRVFIVELQWNPSVENQAISRAIRYGQSKMVQVMRYRVVGTVEEEMMLQQKTKLGLARLGFQPQVEEGRS